MISSTKITVYRDNKISQQETHTAGELATMFEASSVYNHPWPLDRRVGTWLSTWCVMDTESDQYYFTEFMRSHRAVQEAT